MSNFKANADLRNRLAFPAALLLLSGVVLSSGFGGVFGDELAQANPAAVATASDAVAGTESGGSGKAAAGIATEVDSGQEVNAGAKDPAKEGMDSQQNAADGDTQQADYEVGSLKETEQDEAKETEQGVTENAEQDLKEEKEQDPAAKENQGRDAETAGNRSDEALDYLDGDFVQVGEDGKVYTDQEVFVLRLAESIHGEEVNRVEENCLRGCSRVSAVIIPACIDSIGDNAFADCPNLKAVIFEERSDAEGMDLGEDWDGGADLLFEYEEEAEPDTVSEEAIA